MLDAMADEIPSRGRVFKGLNQRRVSISDEIKQFPDEFMGSAQHVFQKLTDSWIGHASLDIVSRGLNDAVKFKQSLVPDSIRTPRIPPSSIVWNSFQSILWTRTCTRVDWSSSGFRSTTKERRNTGLIPCNGILEICFSDISYSRH